MKMLTRLFAALVMVSLPSIAAAQTYHMRQPLARTLGEAEPPAPSDAELAMSLSAKIKQVWDQQVVSYGGLLNVPNNGWQATWDANPKPVGTVPYEGYAMSYPWGHGNARGISMRVTQQTCIDINQRLGHGAAVVPTAWGRWHGCSAFAGGYIYYYNFW